MDSFTITTIYYDGQFWCAFIQKIIHNKFYSGRYVFGEEPSNPRLKIWYLYEFADVQLFETQALQKIRPKDYAKTCIRNKVYKPKSFDKFKEAQKKYLEKKSKDINKNK